MVTHSDAEMRGETAALQQFLRLMLLFASCLAVFYIVTWAVTSSAPLGLSSLVMALLDGAFGAALALLRRGRIQAATVLTSASFLAIAVVYAVITPQVIASLVMLPFIAAAVALPYARRPVMRPLIVACWATILLSFVLARFLQVAPALPPDLLFPVQISGLAAASFGALLLIAQYKSRLDHLLADVRRINSELEAARSGLEVEVATRTADLRRALADVELRAAAEARLGQENAAQRQTILELGVPVLPVGAQTLMIPLVGAIDGERIHQVQERALRELELTKARRLLLDVTGVPLIDSRVAQGLVALSQMARLLGADVTLIGVRPEVAQTIVGLGLDLHMLAATADLQTALSGGRTRA